MQPFPIKLNDGSSLPLVTYWIGHSQIYTMTGLKMPDGSIRPMTAFGAGTAHYKKECAEHIRAALEVGYRSLDAAQEYDNVASVGAALKAWGGKRDAVYLTTKCGLPAPNGNWENGEPRKILLEQLEKLGTDHVDMYLLHHPISFAPKPLGEVWKVMEQLKAEGLTKSIGVSNFRVFELEELEKTWTTPPSVKQIELNPYVVNSPEINALLMYHRKHGIAMQGYGSLRSIKEFPGGPVDTVVERIARGKGEGEGWTASQVLLAWAARYSKGGIVTTSATDEHRREYLKASDLAPQLSVSET